MNVKVEELEEFSAEKFNGEPHLYLPFFDVASILCGGDPLRTPDSRHHGLSVIKRANHSTSIEPRPQMPLPVFPKNAHRLYHVMAGEVYAAVRENFRQAEEFGWFLPGAIGDHVTVVSEVEVHQRAAVLFLVGLMRGVLHVLITKRSNNVGTHQGEACLPGGMSEAGDGSVVNTALREAHEEVHLDQEQVEVLTVMPPFPSVSILVSPVICLLLCSPSELELVPNREVECVFWVPLHIFLRERTELAKNSVWSGKQFQTGGFLYRDPNSGRDHFIWGLTERMCVAASSLALDSCPYFPYTASSVADVNEGKVTMRQLALTSQQRKEWAVMRTKTISKILSAKL